MPAESIDRSQGWLMLAKERAKRYNWDHRRCLDRARHWRSCKSPNVEYAQALEKVAEQLKSRPASEL